MVDKSYAVFSIAALPFIIMAGAIAVVAVFLFLEKLNGNEMTEILVAMGSIWLVVMLVLIFVTQFCMNISPIERFVDMEKALEEAEQAICKMKDDVVIFIKNDLGQAGVDNPALVDAAIVGPVPFCPALPDATTEERLTQMEQTLDQFIGPQLKRTYDISMKCEPFTDMTTDERLQKINATIRSMYIHYLDPLHQKQADLRSGKASDCDKKKGASTAMNASLG